LHAFKGHVQKCQNNIKVFRRKASGIAKGRKKKERKKDEETILTGEYVVPRRVPTCQCRLCLFIHMCVGLCAAVKKVCPRIRQGRGEASTVQD
jgi:radical SAM protein with 4Fe4S-binding SPASM domain